ncbi:MAG TPA: hypothetical protein VLY24_22920 [Bryobacteraceae bacterium]|nr:hypothetical protein [Bryobacteraceae bacterium]
MLLLGLSFVINSGPPTGGSDAQLLEFARHNYAQVLWGSWLQAVGPALIGLFAFSLVHMAGAEHRLAGWMTFFGTTSLMTVSLIEVTFYISALHQQPPAMGPISLAVISAVHHLYFVIAAPAVFLPLGIILRGSDVLPKLFGYSAIALATLFFALGAIYMLTLTLPDAVTALGAVQALGWLAAAVALILRRNRYVEQTSNIT